MAAPNKKDLATNQLAHAILMKMVTAQTLEVAPEALAERAHLIARAFVSGCLPIDGNTDAGDTDATKPEKEDAPA